MRLGRRFRINSGALKDIVVLELGSLIAAPFATRLLADFGARVVKVEALTGDPLRQWGIQHPDLGTSYWSLVQSRSKELIAIDLHKPEGAALVYALAKSADIVVENFRPGRLDEWGIGFDQLKRANPDLIMVSISGYGQTGPYRDRPGFGNIAESMGGIRAVTGYEDGEPLRVGVSLGDQMASLYAVIGALLALRSRDRAGGGEHVDVALTEAVFSFTEAALTEYAVAGVVPQRTGNRLHRAAPSGVFATKDGKWVAIGANGDSIFARFAKAIGHAEWADSPEFMTNAGRVAQVEWLEEQIGEWTKSHTSSEVIATLVAAEVPAGPMYTIADIAQDPNFLQREAIVSFAPAGSADPILMPGIVPKLINHPGSVRFIHHGIGEDTEHVLTDLLHSSPQDIAALRDNGVIR